GSSRLHGYASVRSFLTRHYLSLKPRRIERGLHSERRGVHRAQGHTALTNVQAGETVAMPVIKLAVRREHRLLPVRGPQAQPAIVVMSVAFDVLDAKQRHHRQILKQRHWAEVAQILAR